MAHSEQAPWTVLLIGCALALLLAYVVLTQPAVVQAYVTGSRWLEAHVREAGAWGVAAFVVFAALSVLLGPFSSAPLTPTAVLAWGRLPAFLMLLGGWMLVNTAAYAIGRFGAHPLLRRFVPWQRIESWALHLPKRRAFVLALLVRMTLPSEVGYAYGALRFDFGWYLALTVLAETPTALLLIYGSEALLENHLTRVFTYVLLAIGILLTAWIVRSALRRDHPVST